MASSHKRDGSLSSRGERLNFLSFNNSCKMRRKRRAEEWLGPATCTCIHTYLGSPVLPPRCRRRRPYHHPARPPPTPPGLAARRPPTASRTPRRQDRRSRCGVGRQNTKMRQNATERAKNKRRANLALGHRDVDAVIGGGGGGGGKGASSRATPKSGQCERHTPVDGGFSKQAARFRLVLLPPTEVILIFVREQKAIR